MVIGPSIIRKSTLIEQVRQTAADAANFVELTCSDELRLSHEAQPVIVYVDLPVATSRCGSGRLRVIDEEAFRLDEPERHDWSVLAAEIDRRPGGPIP